MLQQINLARVALYKEREDPGIWATVRTDMDRRALFITAAFAVAVLWMLAPHFASRNGGSATAAHRFPGAWSESSDMGISTALAKAGFSGCGEYRYKANRNGSGEYLVQCTRDGSTWRTYLVWPRIEKASGPFDENDLP